MTLFIFYISKNNFSSVQCVYVCSFNLTHRSNNNFPQNMYFKGSHIEYGGGEGLKGVQ